MRFRWYATLAAPCASDASCYLKLVPYRNLYPTETLPYRNVYRNFGGSGCCTCTYVRSSSLTLSTTQISLILYMYVSVRVRVCVCVCVSVCVCLFEWMSKVKITAVSFSNQWCRRKCRFKKFPHKSIRQIRNIKLPIVTDIKLTMSRNMSNFK